MAELGNAGKNVLEHCFNNDLLLTEDDRRLAHEEFPTIVHVLDNEDLRVEFGKYDGDANHAKRRVHRLGLAAVFCSAVALVATAANPLLKGVPHWVELTAVGAELGALVGAAISIGGVWLGRQKKDWLEARMMAEVLRCWHFQSFICLGANIENSCGGVPAAAAFNDSRRKALNRFVHEWRTSPDSHLVDLVENPDFHFSLLHDEHTVFPKESACLEEIFRAYRVLRFKHQKDFVSHKLQRDTERTFIEILRWPAAVLQARAELTATFCLVLSLILSVMVLGGHSVEASPTLLTFASSGIIVLLVVNVAARAIQDGLAAPEDVQRYDEYHRTIRYLLARFERSSDNGERLELMREMERAAIDELRGFLRANGEARFVV
jgi:hypothetical protein